MSEGRWELIDRDQHTGLEKWIDYDPDTDSILVSTRQDPEIVRLAIERNRHVQNEAHDRRSDFWHAAHVPVSVMYEWKVKHGVDAWNPQHIDGVKRLLNSNEYRYLRVRNFIM
jgi:hypothetical protein